MSFVERFSLWSHEQRVAAHKLPRLIEERELEVVRISFPDQHGLLRGKTVMAGGVAATLADGCTITSSLFAKDTANRTVFPLWTPGGDFGIKAFQGAGDVVMVPDPTTFRILPWVERTGWLLADVYFADGRPVPFATRQLCRDALSRLAEAGYDYVAGLEVEFHIFRTEAARIAPGESGQPGQPPPVNTLGILTRGYQYLSELRFDELEPVLEGLRRDMVGSPRHSSRSWRASAQSGPCGCSGRTWCCFATSRPATVCSAATARTAAPISPSGGASTGACAAPSTAGCST